ncbi:hypothetical protein EB796_016607 [Bugula neritina]|uniref:Complex III assembly factor LYRM7 n=1 Tax=Bugula neritina TaxID=10212 RepID=A0A7J7JFS5_BUGNE|nr:hypothetical protein EB796_016607 [Bugula neritina]
MAPSTALRMEVLSIFRKLHRTRQKIFSGDALALVEARKTINSEFQSRRSQTDEEEINKSIQMAIEAEVVLRKTIVQAKLVDDNNEVFKVKIHPETLRNDNAKLKVGEVPGNIRDNS